MQDAVIDTCCLTNVCTAADLRQIVPFTGLAWYLPPAVVKEAVYIRVRGDDGVLKSQEILLGPYLREGVLTECALGEGEETALFVELAADLADGEAMSLAIAACRGWILASDDRKARRRAAALGTRLISTPEIMRNWAVTKQVASGEIHDALTRIQTLAKFIPSRDFPAYDWWCDALKPGSEA